MMRRRILAGDYERDDASGLIVPRRHGVMHARPQFMHGPAFFGGGDPYFSSVIMLLHGNGTNGSTTFTDSSLYTKTPTANGNVQISTAQSKFGGASIAFDGTGDYLSLNGSSDFSYGTGDFTIEMFVRLASVTALYMLIDHRSVGSTGPQPTLYVNASGNIALYANGADRITGAHGISAATWAHVALCRASGTSRIFVEGVQKGANYTDSINYSISASRPLIGISAYDAVPSAYALNGYIDEIRITKGVARYTTTFTPPTEPFPNN